MKIVVLVNPISGGGRAYLGLKRLIENWPHEGWEVEVLETRGPDHAGDIARELVAEPPDLLAVCSGDGTIKEVATSVPDPPFPVAILPAGTANVLAHEIGLPLDPARALEIALKRQVRRVDLGVLKARRPHHFLIMAGVGFDAYVVSRVRPAAKKRLGIASFYIATFRALLSYPFPEFQVVADGEIFRATSCIIANAKSYGGGLVFTPDASMSDGLFDLLVVEGRARLGHFAFIFSAWRGKPRLQPWIKVRRVPTVRVDGRRGPWVHADGELVGTLPLEVEISGSFPLVVPR